jgi:hypothetical protein
VKVTHVFRNRLSPIPNPSPCVSSPTVKESISIAIPFDLPRKKGAMKQKANFSHGKPKMDKKVRKKELPSVRRQVRCIKFKSEWVRDIPVER